MWYVRPPWGKQWIVGIEVADAGSVISGALGNPIAA